jgi:hypothetical protein
MQMNTFVFGLLHNLFKNSFSAFLVATDQVNGSTTTSQISCNAKTKPCAGTSHQSYHTIQPLFKCRKWVRSLGKIPHAMDDELRFSYEVHQKIISHKPSTNAFIASRICLLGHHSRNWIDLHIAFGMGALSPQKSCPYSAIGTASWRIGNFAGDISNRTAIHQMADSSS